MPPKCYVKTALIQVRPLLIAKPKKIARTDNGAGSSYASATLTEVIQTTTYQIYLSSVSQKR